MKSTYEIRDVVIGAGMPKICAPLTGTTEEELLIECELIRESSADLTEWRVDFFEHALHTESVLVTLERVRKALGNVPLVFSFRTLEEGGEKKITNEQYVSLKKEVIASGHIDIVDIELFRGENIVKELVSIAKENQVLTIVSNHDFEYTPAKEEIKSRVERALNLGAHIPKVALMPVKEEDVLILLETNLELKREFSESVFILIAMSGIGIISRLSGELFGSAITFASVKNASAPGQVTVEEVKRILEVIHHAQ